MSGKNKKIDSTITKPVNSEQHPHDELLSRIQGDAFLVMIVCVLAFFPVMNYAHIYLRYVIIIFSVSLVIGLGIGFVWLRRDYLEFKQTYLKQLNAKQTENQKTKKK